MKENRNKFHTLYKKTICFAKETWLLGKSIFGKKVMQMSNIEILHQLMMLPDVKNTLKLLNGLSLPIALKISHYLDHMAQEKVVLLRHFLIVILS